MVMNPATNKVFGPFWGEFGWEIAQWAPYVNRHAGDTDRIMCMPGHADLYGADVPISQSSPRPDGAVPDMMNCSMSKASMFINLKIKLRKGVPVIDAETLPIPLGPGLGATREHVVLHCRGIEKCEERNLAPAKWDKIVKDLNDNGVVPYLIGSFAHDYSPDGDAVDCTGDPLSSIIMLLRSARVVVGGSSGPMHLAQACETPVVVWSGNAAKDKPRYKEVWNHFDSPTTFVASTWQPGVGKILKAIENAL